MPAVTLCMMAGFLKKQQSQQTEMGQAILELILPLTNVESTAFMQGAGGSVKGGFSGSVRPREGCGGGASRLCNPPADLTNREHALCDSPHRWT